MRLFDDHSRALITAGLLRPIDGAFLAALMAESFTVCNWAMFGRPTAEQFVVVLLATLLACVLWLALLIFRIGVIALRMRADINLMPMAAAKLVEAARLGGAPSLKKV